MLSKTDGNGNTTSYDVDGAGPIQPRSFTYDGENHPLSVTQNGLVASFTYGPDGSRFSKAYISATTRYFGGDELLVDTANPSGLLISAITGGIKRTGLVTSWVAQDNLGSARVMSYMSGGSPSSKHAYGPGASALTNYGPLLAVAN